MRFAASDKDDKAKITMDKSKFTSNRRVKRQEDVRNQLLTRSTGELITVKCLSFLKTIYQPTSTTWR